MRLRLLAALLLLAAPLPAAPVLAETAQETAADCEARLEFPPGGCKCLVAKWATFDENQRVYVAALAKGDTAAARQVQGAMSEKELGQAGFFMATITSAFASC